MEMPGAEEVPIYPEQVPVPTKTKAAAVFRFDNLQRYFYTEQSALIAAELFT